MDIMNMDETKLKQTCCDKLLSLRCVRIFLVALVTTVYTMSTILVNIIIPIAPAALSSHRHIPKSNSSSFFGPRSLISDNVTFENGTNPQELDLKLTNDSFKLGFLFGIRGLVQLLINPFVGHLIDKTFPLVAVMIAIGFDFASNMVYGFASSYPMFMLARVLNAMACSAAGCGSYATLSDYFPKSSDRRKILGFLHVFIFVGVSFAPTYGGLVFQYFGQIHVFIGLMPTWVIACLLSIPVWKYELSKGKKNVKVNKLLDVQNCVFSAPDKNANVIVDDFENNKIEEEENNKNIKSDSPNKMTEDGNVTQSPGMDKYQQSDVAEHLSDTHSVHQSLASKLDNKNILVTSSQLTIEAIKPVPIFRLLTDPYILIGGLGISINNLGILCMAPTLSVYMRETFDVGESEQGIVWSSGAAFHFVGTLFAAFFCQRWPRQIHFLIMAAIGLSGITVFTTLFCKQWYMIFLPVGINFFDIAIGDYCLIPFLSRLVDVRHSSVYGSISAIIMASISLSSSLGAFASGPIVKYFGFSNFIIGVSVTMIAYTPLLLFTHKYWR